MTEIYAANAHEYRKRGYSPLPLPPGRKFPPPAGWTGEFAPMASGPDVQAWIDSGPTEEMPYHPAKGNIALRLPDGVIGIDIDQYGEKVGADSVRAAIKQFGALPSAGRMSSRDKPSGIRLFRVPPGTKLASTFQAAGLGPDVEIIQNHHRYVVAEPSVHPEGGKYGYYDLQGNLTHLPPVNELPELPQAWIDGLQPKEREPREEIPHDAWDEMDAETRTRIGTYVANAWTGIMAELQDMKAWPEDYRGEHGGWEESVLALTASLASLVKADWNDLDVELSVQALELALPHDGGFTLGNGISKFLRAVGNDRIEPRAFPESQYNEIEATFQLAHELNPHRPFVDAAGSSEPPAATVVTVDVDADDWPREPWNEEGNVARTARWAGGSLRWLTDEQVWVRYNGTHWERDPQAGAKAAQRAMKVARWTEQGNYDPNDKVDEKTGQAKPESSELAKFVKALSDQSTDRMFNSVARVLGRQDGIEAASTDFDREEMLLGVANGTVDLRTGELLAGTPEQMISMACPVEYDPTATAPRFYEYLEESIPSEDVRLYLQRVIGYSITGSTIEQAMFMHYGEATNNGKSVLINVLSRMLGEYAGIADPKALIESRNDQHTTHIAGLAGPRTLMMSETARGARLSDVLVKNITGGDEVKARKMHQDGQKYRIVGKIHMATNHLPHIVSSPSTNRRLHVIPWTVQIDNDKIDLELTEKICQELPGVLNWAAEGAKLWWDSMKASQHLKDGERPSGLGMPVEVRQATDAYLGDEDEIGRWLEERTDGRPNGFDTASNLFSDYKWWIERQNGRAMTQTAFSLDLKKRKIKYVRKNSARGFALALLPNQDRSFFDG